MVVALASTALMWISGVTSGVLGRSLSGSSAERSNTRARIECVLENLAVLLEFGRLNIISPDYGGEAAIAYGLSHILHARLASAVRNVAWLACLTGLELATRKLATRMPGSQHEAAVGRWRWASILKGLPGGVR